MRYQRLVLVVGLAFCIPGVADTHRWAASGNGVLTDGKPESGKPESECTFLRRGCLARPSDFRWSGPAAELGFYRGAESVGAEGVLALQVRADCVEFGRIDGFGEQPPVSGVASGVGFRKREPGRMRVDEWVGLAQRIAMEAGPRIGSRIGDHPGTHRVEFDVAQALQEVAIAADRAGFVAAFP